MHAAVELAMSARRENESFRPHTVFEIGSDFAGKHAEAKVLRGPYYECGFNFGWREWSRKGDHYDTDKTQADIWEEVVHAA
jgi:hypothetical protein